MLPPLGDWLIEAKGQQQKVIIHHSIQFMGQFKVLYTLVPGISVQWNTISSCLGRIQLGCNQCMDFIYKMRSAF